MASLAADRTSTELCRRAAQAYANKNTRLSKNPLVHLFMHNYQGKKLILFWDEFDNAYNDKDKARISKVLRTVQNMVTDGNLPSFQAIAFFGSYNANLVSSMGGSQFGYNSIHSHEYVDFSLDETKELFAEYEAEYNVKVSKKVVKDIHKLTGGHAGLTNRCGHVIYEAQKVDKSLFDLTRWKRIFESVVNSITSSQYYNNMTQPLLAIQDRRKTMDLLERLCYDNTGINSVDDDSSEALQQLGFAKMEIRVVDRLLFIKSELIRILALVYIFGDVPPFPAIPWIADDPKEIDIPAILVSCIRNFKPLIVRSAFETARKQSYNNKGGTAPREVIYQSQFHAFWSKAILQVQSMAVSSSRSASPATPNPSSISSSSTERQGVVLDSNLLHQHPPETKQNTRPGPTHQSSSLTNVLLSISSNLPKIQAHISPTERTRKRRYARFPSTTSFMIRSFRTSSCSTRLTQRISQPKQS